MGKKALKNPAKGYLLGELGDTMMRPLFGNVWYVGGGFRNELEPEPKPKPKPKHRLGVRNWVSLSDSLRSGGDSSKPSGSSASSTCSDGTLRLGSGLFSFSFSMVSSIFFCTVEDIFCKQDFSQVAIIFAKCQTWFRYKRSVRIEQTLRRRCEQLSSPLSMFRKKSQLRCDLHLCIFTAHKNCFFRDVLFLIDWNEVWHWTKKVDSALIQETSVIVVIKRKWNVQEKDEEREKETEREKKIPHQRMTEKTFLLLLLITSEEN